MKLSDRALRRIGRDIVAGRRKKSRKDEPLKARPDSTTQPGPGAAKTVPTPASDQPREKARLLAFRNKRLEADD